MSRNAKITVTILALALVGAGVWIANRPQTRTPLHKIRIAANLPMTGQLGYYGVAVQQGAIMAIEEAKVKQPESALASIAVDWQDNASEPKTAVTIFQKQILNNPDIFVSGVKPQVMAIKDEASALGLPHFVYTFDAYINTQSSNNIRTWLSYKIEPPIYMKYVALRHAKSIAITYVRLPHAMEEFEKIVIPALKNKGITVFAEPYDFGRSDFKDIAVKLADAKPDLFILNGFQSDLVGLIRSLRPLSVITDGNTICTYDLMDAAKILGPDEIEGIRIVAPLFESRPKETGIADWRNRYKARYGKEPFYTDAFAYDMMTAIGAAASSDPAPTNHAQWIQAIRNVDVPGITGPIRFDGDGDMITPLEVGVYRNGTLIPDVNAN